MLLGVELNDISVYFTEADTNFESILEREIRNRKLACLISFHPFLCTYRKIEAEFLSSGK